MSRGAVGRTVRGGLARKRVHAIVIGLVLLVSTGASVLALGLVVDSSAPFDDAFAAQRGAHVVASIDPARATPAELAATGRLPQVAAVAGPFAEVTIQSEQGGQPLPPMTLAGRASPGGPVDDITLQSGHWAERPGQVVLADNPSPGENVFMPVGSKITVTGVLGRPTLTIVGIASSVTSSATGWVVPAEAGLLRAPGTTADAQMMYRFRSAGTATAVRADVIAVRSALPPGTVTAAESYLSVRLEESGAIAPFVPFLIAFGVIGLVMSVLIVANVVSGAVVAGYRRIGILKSIGFTPAQVVAAYAGQVTVPAVVGCLAGVVLGNVMAAPLLNKAASVYGVGSLRVPAWVDVAVPLAMCGLAGLAAVLPALRAGRLSAVQAIAAGRAPSAGRGYAAHRLLGRLRLPRPVTIGLAAPFARPARTAITLTAILLGATAVTFAVGLSTSLNRVVYGLSRVQAQPVQVYPASPNVFAFSSAAQRAAETVLREQPGTRHFVAETDGTVSVAGLADGQVPVTAFRGDASWTGYPLNSSLAEPDQYDIGLRPGTSVTAYTQALGSKLGPSYSVSINGRSSHVVTLMLGLIGTLTLLLAIVAGLGVLNTVVLNTRERVHDLGVFKAVGMTPRQTIAMVVCWVAGTGLVAGLVAVPAGILVHHHVLPIMASSANLGLPASYLAVYGGGELAALALAGAVIAVGGALLPAGWAARIATASALRAE